MTWGFFGVVTIVLRCRLLLAVFNTAHKQNARPCGRSGVNALHFHCYL